MKRKYSNLSELKKLVKMISRIDGKIPLLSLYVLLIIVNTAYSQDFQVKSYNADNGFPSDLAKDITIDTLGFVWVATDDGLVRYNGKKFILFNQGFPSKYMKSVYCSGKGELFASSDMGITQIDYDANHVKFSVLIEGSVQPTDGKVWYPKSFFEDSGKNIWFSDNRFIYRIIGKSVKPYNVGEIGMSNNYQRSFSFFETEYLRLFAVSQTGIVFVYNNSTDQFITFRENRINSNVNSVIYVGNDKFLAAHPNHISEVGFRENGKLRKVRVLDRSLDIACFNKAEGGLVYAGSWSSGLYLTDISDPEYKFKPVSDLNLMGAINRFISVGESFWCATDNGIILLKPKLFDKKFTLLSNQYIQQIICDSNGNVYFTDGEKIFFINSSTHEASMVFKTTGSVILRILDTKEGLWFTDNRGLLKLLKHGKVVVTKDLSNYGAALHFITKDKENNFWLCQDGHLGVLRVAVDGSVTLFDENQGLNASISVIRELKDGKLLFGGTSQNSFLFSFDKKIGKFIDESVKVLFEHNIPINVNDIAESPDGELFLATSHGLVTINSKGLNRISLDDFTKEDIKAMAIDQEGSMWLAVSKGLLKYKSGDIFLFDNSDGLPSKTLTYRCLTIDKFNQVWAGTLAGVTISKNQQKTAITVSPKIITVKINNREIDLSSKTIVRKTDFIVIDFISPVYPSEQVIYEYWLQGKDSAWIRSYTNAEVLLSDFHTGEYTFMVRARQKGNHTWSKPVEYSFHVTIAFYLQWWAFLLYGFIVFLIIFIITRWRIRHHEKERIRLNHLVKVRTNQLERKNKEIELQNAELEKAKELAEQSAKAKSEFLSTISHEIRTPLHGVIGMTDFLLTEKPREDQLDKLNTLKFSAENLLLLINDVLDLNKIDAGKIELEEIAFNLHQLLNTVAHSYELAAKEKNLLLVLRIDNNVPVTVTGDPNKLTQILNNLLGNAIKFTNQGEVRIDLSLKDKNNEKVRLQFLISDTGIGIPETKLGHIFDPFSQASTDTTRKFGGSGLGLTITGKLLTLMGSAIQVKSEVGKGSRFWFELSLKVAADKIENAGNTKHSPPFVSLKGLRILLVEDNVINIKIARQFLERWEIVTDVAESGKEALKLVFENRYDLILMDLHLPDMDGFSITFEIRKQFAKVPIIALTADAQSKVRISALESGMNAYLTKPFNPKELYSMIVKHTSEQE